MQMTSKKEAVLDVLEEGRDNAITSSEIAERLEISEDNGNPVSRGLITELVEDGHPVIACHNGYFIASDADDVRQYLKDLNSRIQGIEERKIRILEAFNSGE